MSRFVAKNCDLFFENVTFQNLKNVTKHDFLSWIVISSVRHSAFVTYKPKVIRNEQRKP